MKINNILYSLVLASFLTACGSVSDRGESSITSDEKIAQYLSKHQNHVSNIASSLDMKSRSYPGANFTASTFYITKNDGKLYVQKNGSVLNVSENKAQKVSLNKKVSKTYGSYGEATIKSKKDNYKSGESIKVTVSGMLGDDQDWVGVYRYGDNNDWDNVQSWAWTNGVKKGSIKLDGLKEGYYEVRAFFENSFSDVAYATFTVSGSGNGSTYDNKEEENDNNQQNNDNNQDAQNDDNNNHQNDAQDDNQNNDNNQNAQNDDNNNHQDDAQNDNQNNNNNQNDDNNHQNDNQNNNNNQNDAQQDNNHQAAAGEIVYEDANNGLSANWTTVIGPFSAKAIGGAVKLTTNWISNTVNDAEYQFSTSHDEAHQTLELDIGGLGNAGGHVGGIHANSPAGFMPHFTIGVFVTTKYGSRAMVWDSYFNHEGYDAFRADYGNGNVWLNYPSPKEHVRGYGFQNNLKKWEHFKVNLNTYLKQLEPGNKIISVDRFMSTGGYLDNIKLTNN